MRLIAVATFQEALDALWTPARPEHPFVPHAMR